MSKLTHNRVLDAQTEAQVVAMIARGDSYSSIQEQLKGEGVEISISTIAKVKSRNPQALAKIQSILVERQASQAEAILAKSRTLINRRLDQATRVEEDLVKLTEDFDNELISREEYNARFAHIVSHELSITELNSVSKEAFSQSQIEAGKPTSITDNPTQAKENLRVLLDAIQRNDTRGMLEAIFPDAKPKTV